MEKKYFLEKINKNLKDSIGIEITEEILDILIVDISRILDKKITKQINEIKTNKNIKINTNLKEKLRKRLLGYSNINLYNDIPKLKFTEEDIENAYTLIKIGLSKNENKIINSIVARYKINYLEKEDSLLNNYIEYIANEEVSKYQLIALKVDKNLIQNSDYIIEIIMKYYNQLSNYHYLIIEFEDEENNPIPWKLIAEVAIALENLYDEKEFEVFNKKKKSFIETTSNFIKNNSRLKNTENLKNIIQNFYSSVSYGFQFMDLYIQENGNKKVLIMQKIELDEKIIPCPSCFKTEARGNSYPRVLLKSFECQNPHCPSRSKSGRGKRYDLFGVKKQLMLEKHDKNNYIDDFLYKKYRRDIVSGSIDISELIRFYSWENDKILFLNYIMDKNEYLGRSIDTEKIDLKLSSNNKNLYDKIKIMKLYKEIFKEITPPKDEEKNIEEIKNINKQILCKGNSNNLLYNTLIKKYKIDSAITSPPYFNAREYSQWENLLCYFIDMMINAKAVFDSISKKGTYIYNIGDIVAQDNIYVKSKMSNRRQMLGFYSILIFTIVGFKCNTNIIWDKGEVQSKRNSTPNHYPGYVKPINVYEHMFVFSKLERNLKTRIAKIDPVIKINSKGENIYGHTAPYPLKLIELLIPFIDDKTKYILDPFLGSGTTLLALYKNGLKGIGIELNSIYYKLSCERITHHKE